jgi:periplasmic protein TonB
MAVDWPRYFAIMQAEIRSLPPVSSAVCRNGGCSLLWSLLWHALVVLAVLHLGQCVTREPPQLLVNEVQLVHEPSPEPPSPVQPLPPVAPSVQPQVPPVAKPAAAPTRRAVAPPRLSAAATTSPVAEPAPQTAPTTATNGGTTETAASADGGAVRMAAHTAAPGYHLGAVETPAPDYPFAARKRRRQGLVLVQLDVGADGRVDRVVLLESSGDSTLDEAAMITLGRWRLRPATENNRPVPGRVEVPVRFRLE